MRRYSFIIAAILFSVLITSASARCEITKIEGKTISLVFDSGAGTFSLFKSDGSPVLLNAHSEVISTKAGVISTRGMKIESAGEERIANALGAGRRLTVIYTDDDKGARIEQALTLYDNPEYVTTELSLLSKRPMKIRRMIPVAARFDDGAGLFVGADASATQVLENGGSIKDMPFLDFYINLQDANKISSSNWSACVYDRASKTSYLSGFLTNRKSLTSVKTIGGGGGIESGGARAFNTYEGVTLFSPAVPMKKNTPLQCEPFFIDAVTGNVFDRLEGFAKAFSTWTGKKLWTDPVPMGWNSWGGGYGSGGMGTKIDEKIILDNLDAAAEKFRKYGLRYFQIDDGYEIAEGEWEANEKFPHGMKWLADRIREKGFKPGIWINGFLSTREASIWKEHPEWFAEKSSFGKIMVPDNWEIIDFSHPGAKQWLRDLFTKITKDWGYEWIKLDFAYWSLLGDKHYDSTKSAAEIYTDALKIVRDAIGPDVHLLVVSLAPLNSEYADSVRITLDNEPWWNPSDNNFGAAGIKPTVLAFQRRYYLHQSAFINNNDLIYFRESSDRDERVGVTMNEARAFVSAVGLSGSIVKLGETWLDMTPEWTSVLSRIMPPYGRAARPIDLFEKEWAQIHHLPVTTPAGGSHSIVGLFNWGLNKDLVTHEETPEETKEVGTSLYALGLEGTHLVYEFWSRKFIGETGDKVAMTLEPRTEAVLALRKKTGAPQFLGTSRHFTMGGTDLLAESWDADAGSLSLRFSGTADEPFEIAVYLPDGYSFKRLATSGNLQYVSTENEPNVLKILFKTSSADEFELKVFTTEN